MLLLKRGLAMSIIEDFRKKFENLSAKNQKRQQEEVYERKKQQIEDQKKQLTEAWDELEEQAQKMDEVVKKFRKAKQ